MGMAHAGCCTCMRACPSAQLPHVHAHMRARTIMQLAGTYAGRTGAGTCVRMHTIQVKPSAADKRLRVIRRSPSSRESRPADPVPEDPERLLDLGI